MTMVSSDTASRSSSTPILIDARGPRFGAAITTAVLALALVLHSPIAIIFQLVVFATGAIFGPQKTFYAWIYRSLLKPRLAGEVPTEDVRPPQFAQRVGFAFALVATLGLVASSSLTFTIATSFALAAAFLNAAFNFCLGCEIYLPIARLRNRTSSIAA